MHLRTRIKSAGTFLTHGVYSEHVFLVCSGDRPSWCLAHGWCVTVCMLLVRFHCYMSSLHPNYADRQCIMTRHTIHSSVTTCFKATRVGRAPATESNPGDPHTHQRRLRFYGPAGSTQKDINAETWFKTSKSRINWHEFNATWPENFKNKLCIKQAQVAKIKNTITY